MKDAPLHFVYPICGMNWYSLNIVDYALMAELSYSTKYTKECADAVC